MDSSVTEIWMRGNRRLLYIATFGLVLLLATLLGLGFVSNAEWVRGVAIGLSAAALFVATPLLWYLARPRLVRRGDELLLNVRFGPPQRVPLDFVEGFLLGQGPAFLPGESLDNAETTTVVIRLADRAEDFRRRQTHPVLASWCDGYVTLRGTWCEPISLATVEQLNARLAELNLTARREPSRTSP